MTIGGLLLLVTIVAVVIGFVRVKEQGERISKLEKKISKKGESKEK